jgi:hypothetical protein
MLNIRITGINGPIGGDPTKYELTLDGNGKGRGHSLAYDPKEDVQWEIAGNVIDRIEAVTWKQVSGSTNIFPETGSPGSPTPLNPQKKVWRAKINDISGVAYVYSIKFVRNASDPTIYEFDPIISIKPTSGFINTFLYAVSAVATAVLAFFTFQFLFKKLKK